MCTKENGSNLEKEAFESKKMNDEMRERQDFSIWSELDKPFDEMDMAQIAASADEARQSAFEDAQSRQQMLDALARDASLSRMLARQKSRSRGGRRFASVAAIVFAVIIGTGLTARAFFWEQFLSFMAPVTEFFSVTSATSDGGELTLEQRQENADDLFNTPPPEDALYYQDFESMLENLGDSFAWILMLSGDYAFISGKTVSGEDFLDVTLEIEGDDASLVIFVESYPQDLQAEDIIYEKLQEISGDKYDYVKDFGALSVFFATNIDTSYAHWVHDRNYFQVWGGTSHTSLEKIVKIITEESQ